jgi:hypothetical protein
MRFLRLQGVLALAVSSIAVAACGRPTEETDLRPEGAPQVTTVMVRSDVVSITGVAPNTVIEPAIYCPSTFDPESPTFVGLPNFDIVQICPDEDEPTTIPEVENADPLNVGVRVVFDELLDPDIETLTDSETGGPCTDASDTCDGHIASTQPLNIDCGNQGEITYDGYYQPNGNNVSWPPGPSIVALPDVYIASGSTCSVTLNTNIVDKQGEPVPTSDLGPFDFTLSPFTLVGSDPGDGDVIAPDGAVAIDTNVLPDGASIDATDITASDGAAIPIDVTVDGTTIIVAPTGGTWPTGVDIVITIPSDATIADIAGGPYVAAADFTLTFQAAL